MILLIDNYDSFSYNLYQALGTALLKTRTPDLKVIRNDELTIEEITKLKPGCIVISPGPGKPSDAGICIEVIKKLGSNIPVFGICLGHQAIFEAFGGTVSYAKRLMHGKSSSVNVDNENALFKGLPPVIKAARYHSLAGVEDTLPSSLKVIARTEDGEIMAVCHKEHPIFGVQFHPESILTPEGKTIIGNFIENYVK
jgi:anthranilate synthase component 2